MFDELVAATTGAFGARAVDAWVRVENAACAHRMAAMVTMLDQAYAQSGSADREQWCIDSWDAVIAHIGAAGRLTCGAVSDHLLVGVGLRDDFPTLAALFAEGLITYAQAKLIVFRSLLVKDRAHVALLDTRLAELLQQAGTPLSSYKLEKNLDAMIWELDPLAVRRTQSRARGRDAEITFDEDTGMAYLAATLFATDGHALRERLYALAATTCPHDPRPIGQRRADAIGAIGRGMDRLDCRCGREDCTAAQNPSSTGVVVHIVAHHDTIDDTAAPTAPPPDPTPEAEAENHCETDEARSESAGCRPVSHHGHEPNSPADQTETTSETNEPATDTGPQTDRPPTTPRQEPNLPAPTPAEECAALDGPPQREFAKALLNPTDDEDPGSLSTLAPATILGGTQLPGAIARHSAHRATRSIIVHPGQAPPENRYTPSRTLAEFVRCRDLTCRFPGCTQPAINCDIDHTIPYPYGPTAASNLKCLCRRHHLLKTFWSGPTGWRERQHPDGTIDWIAPDHRTHTTTPGSQLLFPTLCRPTAPIHATEIPPAHTTGLTMPRRTATRAQHRRRRIHGERERNRIALEEETALTGQLPTWATELTPVRLNSDPPPF